MCRLWLSSERGRHTECGRCESLMSDTYLFVFIFFFLFTMEQSIKKCFTLLCHCEFIPEASPQWRKKEEIPERNKPEKKKKKIS